MLISVCRSTLNKPNWKYKGVFLKNFDSLEKLALFMCKNRNRFVFPYIDKELNNNEYYVLVRKYRSMISKHL